MFSRIIVSNTFSNPMAEVPFEDLKEGDLIYVASYKGRQEGYSGVVEKVRKVRISPLLDSSLPPEERSDILLTVKLDREMPDHNGKVSQFRQFYSKFINK